MSSGEPLRDLARAAGIATTYHGPDGRRARGVARDAASDSGGDGSRRDHRRRGRGPAGRAEGSPRRAACAAAGRWWRRERRASCRSPTKPRRWRLQLEDGTELSGVADEAPPPLPVGYHTLAAGGDVAMVLAVPPTPPLPDRAWGLTLPLYGLRPPRGAGSATIPISRGQPRGLARQGAAFVGINPVHAGFLEDANANSPYSPSHRRRLNVLHVARRAGPGRRRAAHRLRGRAIVQARRARDRVPQLREGRGRSARSRPGCAIRTTRCTPSPCIRFCRKPSGPTGTSGRRIFTRPTPRRWRRSRPERSTASGSTRSCNGRPKPSFSTPPSRRERPA